MQTRALLSGLFSAALLLLSAPAAFADSSDESLTLDDGPSAELTTKPSRAAAPRPHDHLTLLVPSIVVHGFQPAKETAAVMPNKLDPTGTSVETPGLGLAYETKAGFTVLAAAFKDCYNDLAGTFQLGETFHLTSRTDVGLTMGIYARETPIVCSKVGGGRNTQTRCESIDGFDFKFLTTVNGESVDIIPMPFLHFSTALWKDRDFELDFKVMSNFALNEFGIAVPF